MSVLEIRKIEDLVLREEAIYKRFKELDRVAENEEELQELMEELTYIKMTQAGFKC